MCINTPSQSAGQALLETAVDHFGLQNVPVTGFYARQYQIRQTDPNCKYPFNQMDPTVKLGKNNPLIIEMKQLAVVKNVTVQLKYVLIPIETPRGKIYTKNGVVYVNKEPVACIGTDNDEMLVSRAIDYLRGL